MKLRAYRRLPAKFFYEVPWSSQFSEKVFTEAATHRRCSLKKVVVKNFANFTEKHLCWSIFLTKLRAFSLQFIKKETPAQAFSCEGCKTFKNTHFESILKNICEWLLLYLAKEVEQNFMIQNFLVNKRKRLNTISKTKPNTVHLK